MLTKHPFCDENFSVFNKYGGCDVYHIRLSLNGSGCAARIGIRKSVTAITGHHRITINETSLATGKRFTINTLGPYLDAFDLIDQFWQNNQGIAHDAQIGQLKYGGIGVFVDGNDFF